MTQVVKLKRSATPGKVPTTADLELGEIAINTYDGKLYFEQDSGTPAVVSVATSTDLALKQDTLVSGTSIKTVNGASILGSGNIVAGDVTLAGTQTLTNKTLSFPVLNSASAGNLILLDGCRETVFAITGTNPSISPKDGSILTWTLTAASTPTAGTWASGQSLTLMIDDGNAYTVNWTSMAITWKTDSAAAPTLSTTTTGYTAIQLWKVGTVIYGARVGNA